MVVRYKQEAIIEDVPSRVIQGFTGSGMIASLALYRLFDLFDFKHVGFFSFDKIPPVAAVRDGIATHPLRVYASAQLGFAVVCDVPLPEAAVPVAVDELIRWYGEQSIKEIIILAGAPSGREITDEEVKIRTIQNGLPMPMGDISKLTIMKKGATYGSVALTLLKSKEAEIPSIAIIAECIPNIPDYGAVASLLAQLADYLDVTVDTKELTSNAYELRKKLTNSVPGLDGNGTQDSTSYT